MADLNKDLNDVQRATQAVAYNAEHQTTPKMAGKTNVAQVQPTKPNNKPASAGAVEVKKEAPEAPQDEEPVVQHGLDERVSGITKVPTKPAENKTFGVDATPKEAHVGDTPFQRITDEENAKLAEQTRQGFHKTKADAAFYPSNTFHGALSDYGRNAYNAFYKTKGWNL